MIVIVDTNVAVVANQQAEQASAECVLNCVQHLDSIINEGQLALDDQWRIIQEYLHYLRPEGQPGVGDRFLRWVLLNRANPDRCTLVSVTPLADNPKDFLEFPTDERLKKFDPSDRKFVAVALTHPDCPPILNAVDTDWWIFREALEENGVRIEFVCVDDVQRLV